VLYRENEDRESNILFLNPAMSPRSLFIIILRILGIFFVKDLIGGLVGFASVVIAVFMESRPDPFWMLFLTAIAPAVYFLICYFLLFRTNAIIDRLRLAEEFDEPELNVSLNSTSILRIVLIATAAVILTLEIPDLFRTLFFYYRDRNNAYENSGHDYSPVILSLVKIVIAGLMIGERKRIIAFVEAREDVHNAERNP
jgi:cell division protein FtsW (lipid II flippase)